MTVSNKGKGYLRDLLDAIHHMASPDAFGCWRPVESFIINKVLIAMRDGKIPQHNCDVFLKSNEKRFQSTMYYVRKFNVKLISAMVEAFNSSDGNDLYDGDSDSDFL